MGFRPSMPDSLPMIGKVPSADNAVLAFGHGHLGLTLGAITGKLAARSRSPRPRRRLTSRRTGRSGFGRELL
jgi:D-amino-acid dehydrogenase